MCLDYRLHTKIIESITMIQRWFKTKIQKFKYAACRSAAIKIQSYWRMHLAQKQLAKLKLRTNAAIIIQATFKMFMQRKWYTKLVKGVVIVQAHIKGKQARIRFKRNYRQKILKERYKLRPTQSLPINEKTSEADKYDIEMSRSYPKLVHYSLDLDLENIAAKNRGSETKSLLEQNKSGEIQTKHKSTLTRQSHDVLHKAEYQFRNLMIPTKNNTDENVPSSQQVRDDANTNVEGNTKQLTNIISEESVDSRSPRTYNLEYATKQYFDDSFTSKRYKF